MTELSGTAEQKGGKRILIVEDDAIVAKVYQRRLSKAGFDVSIASEGSDGFFSIITSKPDGVLLDLMLPQMDGLQILRKTRAQKQFERTPILVFSNAFMNGMLQDAAEAGATMVINKSDADAIETIVETFLQHLCRIPAPLVRVNPPAPAENAPVAQASESQSPIERSATPVPAVINTNPVPRQLQVEVAPSTPTPVAPSITPQPPARTAAGAPRRFGVFPAARRSLAPDDLASSPAPSASRTSAAPSAVRPAGLVRATRSSETNVSGSDEEKIDRSAELEILNVFFDGGNETIAEARSELREYQKDPSSSQGRERLETLYRHIHKLTGISAMCSSESISNFSACLEALLHELILKPDSFRPSTLKTLAAAVDVLSRMFKQAGRYECLQTSQAMVLVIDEDVVSQRAMTLSLQKARLNAVCVGDAASALDQMREVLFELIILEPAMPDVDGFELCSQIRAIPGYESTPILFVTGLNDFQSRARSVTVGAADFISKPLCRIEMTVKALTFAMKGRLAGTPEQNPALAS